MKYGDFTKDGKEFVVTKPNTPRPWFNYLFNDVYHCLVSQTGGGFSYLKDPKYFRILRYDHISTDRPGRYVFIRDTKTSEVWSANWQPLRRKLDSWEARHGLGYTTVTAKKSNVESRITYFVPHQAPLEVWLVTLRNTSKQKKTLKVFPTVDLVCGDIALESHYRNIICLYNEGYFDEGLKAVVAFKHPFRTEQLNGYGFFSASLPIKGFDVNREKFLGRYNEFFHPERILEKGSCANSVCRGEDMVGVLELDVSLKPREEKTFVVCLGFVEEKNAIARWLERYTKVSVAKQELQKVKDFWETQTQRIFVKTPDKKFDLMTNMWGKYQLCAITHWRGTSHYHGVEGGLGYRDTAQDIEGLLSVDMELAKKKMYKILYYQYNCGHAVSGFSDIEGTWENMGQAGVVKKADVAVWLPYTIVSYVKETGDVHFLKEVVPFHDGGEATVYEHVVRAIRHLYATRGEHGLPLIGKADWNDAYDHVGYKNKGESVWLGMAFCRACLHIEELAHFIGDAATAREMREKYEELKKVVNNTGWDGSWYLAAFNDEGYKIGSSENREGKVPLNSQTWAILSHVVTPERLPKILDKIDNYLDTQYGPALFLPSYTHFNPGIGRVTAFAEGTKENAAVFSHACAFKVVADCTIKRNEEAYDTFKKLFPMSEAKSDHEKYKAEPYVWAEYVVGPGSKDRFGEGAFTWNTGTTPWMFIAATEWILGVRREFKGLLVDPCIPKQWKECFVRRPFRNAVYEITIKNQKGKGKKVSKMTVDGKVLDGVIIPPHGDGKVHKVEVIL